MPIRLWERLYHLTHQRNVPSILEHGILSWTEVKNRGLSQVDISDPDVQRWRDRIEPVWNRSIHDYACLYLNPKNPMLFVRRDIQNQLVILEISLDVLRDHEHVFTDGNAACSKTSFGAARAVVEPSEPVLRAPRWADYRDGRRRRCAEVLVYPSVEPAYIVGAICDSLVTADRIAALCPFPVHSDPDVYF